MLNNNLPIKNSSTKKSNKVVLKLPIRARIEICRFCNLKCSSCPIGRGKIKNKKMMSFSNFKFIIDKIKISVKELSLFNYGEPLLNPEIVKMIKYAKKNGIKIVNIHTNGLLLNKKLSKQLVESGLDYISFSIDGASEETYKKYRIGGDFNKLVKNIREFIEIKKNLKSRKPFIEAQFVVMKHNQHEINKFGQIFKKIGVNKVVFKTFNAYMSGYKDREKNLKYLPTDTNYSRYKTLEAKELFDVYKSNYCVWAWENVVINANGDIALCCHDFNADLKLGNILHNENWWDNNNRRKIQARILDKKNALCKHCNIGVLYLN
jgi:radical SAM protein with 4Fe4S-binding SPASM domain